MTTAIRVPALPESIADATVLAWHKQPGEAVVQGENLVDLETDKVVLEVPAPATGFLAEIAVPVGETVAADALLGRIAAAAESSAPGAPAVSPLEDSPPEEVAPAEGVPLAPAARRLVKELALDPAAIPGSGKDGRIQKTDVLAFLDTQESRQPPADPDSAPSSPQWTGEADRPEQRVPMTRLRARVAERLVQAQQTAAILTTFNEVNLQPVLDLRAKYREPFEKTHGVRLGFMSFFVKAAVEALQRFPVVNAAIDGSDILYRGYYDIGIAVSSPRGLVVPILRHCDQLTMAEVERGIAEFGGKAQDGTLSFEELTGGTFSITNGGVFGSLLSTPILNPPQSAILGMHRVQPRPVAEQGEVVIRPMMYLALSYDHRLIDGREAVQFLVAIKDVIEDPARLLLHI